MAINERLIHTAAEIAAGNTGEEGLILHLDANDVDSYDGDGSVWYDIKDHEYTPATNVDEHFNTVLYTGTGATNSITGVGFQPDLIWIKDRTATENHYLMDSVRGKNGSAVFENLYPNLTNAQANDNSLTSLDEDGFTLQASGNGNVSGESNVAWCFKAGGAAVSNTDGDITSSVSANNDLGFSIVSYTGNNSTGQTVGHGLDVPPELIFVKRTNADRDWRTYAKPLGATKYLDLNEANAAGTFGSWNNTEPTATVFSTSDGSDTATNNNNDNYIAYCFTSKRGVSKVGTYEGNSSSTGVKVYTGFEPAFVLFKPVDAATGWSIHDNKRGVDKQLNPNISNAESSGWSPYLEFHRDGFKVKGSSSGLNPSSTMLYYAVAKNTKETDLIDDTDLELHLDPTSYSGSGTTWTADAGSNATVVASRYDKELGDSFDISTDSESTIVIPSGHPLNGNHFTLEFWFRSTEDWNNSGKGHYFIYEGASAGWNFFYYEGLGWRMSAPVATGYFGNGTVKTNKWHHVSLTYTNGTTKFYLDGELLKTHSETRASSSLSSFDFGSTESAAYKPKCLVGQIRMYSSALTQDEVRQNFNFTKSSYPNGYNGTISGATFLPSGVSFDFDGSNDYVKIPATNHSPVDFSKKNYTISLWINPDNVNTNQPIFTKYGNSDSLRSIYFNIHSDGTLRLYQRATGTDNTVYSSGTISASTWTHVAVVRDSNTVKFYIDGNLDVSRSSTFTPNAGGTQSINIGSQADGNYNFFDGKISDVKIFDRVLTDNEVLEQEAIGYNGIG